MVCESLSTDLLAELYVVLLKRKKNKKRTKIVILPISISISDGVGCFSDARILSR